MVRLSEAMKDVLSCEKPGEDAPNLRSPGVRMGQPSLVNQDYPKGSQPGELKHLSSQRKRNRRDSASSGERQRKRPNQGVYSLGL
jgi:hypothetical protein